jgi:hypothetical protein
VDSRYRAGRGEFVLVFARLLLVRISSASSGGGGLGEGEHASVTWPVAVFKAADRQAPLRGIVVGMASGQHNVFNDPVRPHGNGPTTQGLVFGPGRVSRPFK